MKLLGRGKQRTGFNADGALSESKTMLGFYERFHKHADHYDRRKVIWSACCPEISQYVMMLLQTSAEIRSFCGNLQILRP